jgi:hypothetical protein
MIYPNPVVYLITVESILHDYHIIEITCMNGQLIYIGKSEGAVHHIDLSSFQKGIYFITIRSKDFVTTRKVIKL